jgi:hypothetical protein
MTACHHHRRGSPRLPETFLPGSYCMLGRQVSVQLWGLAATCNFNSWRAEAVSRSSRGLSLQCTCTTATRQYAGMRKDT